MKNGNIYFCEDDSAFYITTPDVKDVLKALEEKDCIDINI